jgi:hypothetical protein
MLPTERESAMKRPPSRTAPFLPPLVWTAFLWLYIVEASDAEFQPFYLLIRGRGAVIYPSAIVLLSRSVDLDLFLAVSAALLVTHFLLFGKDSVEDSGALLAVVSFAVSFAGFAATTSTLFIALLGISSIVLVAADGRRASLLAGITPGRMLSYFALCVAAVLAALAVASSARWILAGLDGSIPLSGWSWQPAYFSLQLLGVLAPILPQLALLFFFAWAIRLALSPLLHLAGSWTADLVKGEDSPSQPTTWLSSRRLSYTILGIAVAVAIFVALYPYLPAVNPKSMLVGVDVQMCYSHVLNSQPVPVNGVCGNSAYTYGIQRLGALEMLRGLAALSGSNTLALKVAPLILAPLLTVSTYLLVLEGTGDRFTAGLSALFASVSPEAVAGINAGFIANWLAIGVAFLFFAALLHTLRTKRPAYLLLSYAIFVGLLFIHPWTWTVALVVLVAYLSLSLLESAWVGDLRSKKLDAAILLSLLLAGVAADALRSTLPVGSGFATAYATLVPELRLSNVTLAVVHLRSTFVMFLLGGLADPVWFILGVVGILSLPSLRGRFGKLLFTWVAAMSFALVLVSPTGDGTLQARLIYDVPLQVFAAVGLVAILRVVVGALEDGTISGKKLGSLMAALAIIGVMGLLLGFALDNVGFLYP